MSKFIFEGMCFICKECRYFFTGGESTEKIGIRNGIMNWTVPLIPKCPKCGGIKVALNLIDFD